MCCVDHHHAMYGVLGHRLHRVFTGLMAWPLAAVVQTCICGVDGKTEAARGNIHQNSLRVMMQPMFFHQWCESPTDARSFGT